MKKLFLPLMMVSTPAFAGYWDCNINFSSQHWNMAAYSGSVVEEISADRRTEAEYKASSNGFTVEKKLVFGKSRKYVCAKGVKEENGKPCKYAVDSVSCSRQ